MQSPACWNCVAALAVAGAIVNLVMLTSLGDLGRDHLFGTGIEPMIPEQSFQARTEALNQANKLSRTFTNGGNRDRFVGCLFLSDTSSKVEVITGVARRRRFSTDAKLAMFAETMQPGMSISYVARRGALDLKKQGCRISMDDKTLLASRCAITEGLASARNVTCFRA